ncbi:hypothetical protein [Ereboglobus luteus]|uniref:TonB-dependent receptor plug domain-containing protein n=1 Tax=Ereboglobus luteus TaxID=1796921 RepID=A0A2U8E5T8_9BACT|nr:hypothetical protein [Ereboglobus luteus]AWI10223.1 hypothetical protein CKA38_14060 [Ereboglobus luteus]
MFAGTLFSFGQMSPNAAKSATTPGDDEIVELSPFVVSVERSESGYMAKETVAGNRLRADIKDVGASIDALTNELLDDIGAWNAQDALKVVANLATFEGSVDSGDVINDSQWFNTNYYSRGFATGSQRVDFFPRLMVPIDRFSTESLTFSRGPNAILIGVGSPGGSIGSTSKRPNLGKNRLSVAYTTDKYGSSRGEFDLNTVLLKRNLAVRVAGVSQNRKTYKQPSLDGFDSLYGAVTWRPFRHTSLTVNYEEGARRRYLDINNAFYDAYTPWVLAGCPTVNWMTGEGQNDTGKGNFTASAASGLGNYSTAHNLVYVEGGDGKVQDWMNMARSAHWQSSTAAAADNSLIPFVSFTEDSNLLEMPDGTQWRLDLTKNLYGDRAYHRTDYKNMSAFLEQQLFRGMSLELAANKHISEYMFDGQGWGSGATRTIYVDPNELLPDGSPNPHVGQPYIEDSSMEDTRQKWELKNYRATLVYDFSLEELFGKFGLGRHRLMGLYENNREDNWFAVGRYVNTTPLTGFNTQINNAQNALRRRWYLSPGAEVYQSDGNLVGVDVGTGVNIDKVMAQQAPRRSITETESFVGAIQSNFVRTKAGYYRLTALYGYRRDILDQKSMTFARNAVNGFDGDYTNWSSAIQSGTWNPRTRTRVGTKTYSFVLRPFQRVGLTYNYSDIFVSGAANAGDIFGNALRPTYGETKDWGVKIDLWEGRIFASFTYFETAQRDVTTQLPASMMDYANRIWNTIDSTKVLNTSLNRFYRDDSTDGIEFALVGNIGKAVRMRLTVGQQKTTITKYASEVVDYINQNWAVWQENRNVILTVTNAAARTVGDAANVYKQNVADARAIIGKRGSNSREWNSNFNVNYTFQKGWFKGVTAGVDMRWKSRSIIGYQRMNNGELDIHNAYYGPAEFKMNMNVGYGRRLWNNKVHWDIRLYVYNVLDNDDLQPRRAVDSGVNHAAFILERYTQEPRTFQIRSSLTF